MTWICYTFLGGSFPVTTPPTDWSAQATSGVSSDTGQPLSHLVLPVPGAGAQSAIIQVFYVNTAIINIIVSQAGAGAAACQINIGGDITEITTPGAYSFVLPGGGGPFFISITCNGAIDVRGFISDDPVSGAAGSPPSPGTLTFIDPGPPI